MIQADPVETILIVDDVMSNILLLKHALSSAYRIITANSALDGLQLALRELPNLILLDVMMPGMNGYEVYQLLKDDELTREIPVIFLTALDNVEDELHGLQLGAVDYITKPFNPAIVRARVRSQLGLKKYQLLKADLINQDGLTGLANRLYFDSRMAAEWKRAQREAKPLALILADIDFFRAYNEFYGHIAGDECIKQVATAVKQALRSSADMCSRYGGGVFALLLPDTSESDALLIAETLRAQIEQEHIPHENSALKYLTVSFGVCAVTPAVNAIWQDLVAMADAFLNSAKAHGRNRVHTTGSPDAAVETLAADISRHEQNSGALIDSIVSLTEQQDQQSLDMSLVASLNEMLQPVLIVIMEFSDHIKKGLIVLQGDKNIQLPDNLWELARALRGTEISRYEHPLFSCLLVPLETAQGALHRVLMVGVPEWNEFNERLFIGMLRVQQNFLRLMQEGEKDTLTGLQNRRTLERQLSALLSARMHGRRSADTSKVDVLAVLDLDKFKRINDTFGHLIGDEVLLKFAQILRVSLRDNDSAYRYGGEEFIVIIREVTEVEAYDILDRLRHHVELHDFPQVHRVTVSTGYTSIDRQTLPAQIIEEADKALYYAKEHGRNQVRHYAKLPDEEKIGAAVNEGDIELF